jgi:hypothetical protein
MKSHKKNKLPVDLYEEALKLLNASEILKKTVIWQDKQVDKFLKKYPSEIVDELPWDERERVRGEMEELYARLNESVRELNGMDKKMQILKENVKKRCGRDVMSSKTSKSKKINLKELLGGEGIMLV